jgi:hypothetical protein
MFGQPRAGFLEMRGHAFRYFAPEMFTAALVDCLSTNDGELLRARRDEDEHAVGFSRVHQAEPAFPPRRCELATMGPRPRIATMEN